MSIKQATWIHGGNVVLESSSWRARRQGPCATVTPYESNKGWCHVVIPTPVIVDGDRLRASSALVRLQTGPGAKLIGFHVYDGEKIVAEYDDLDVTAPSPDTFRYDVTNHPEVLYGTIICVLVQFTSENATDDWVRVIGAGIDFHN